MVAGPSGIVMLAWGLEMGVELGDTVGVGLGEMGGVLHGGGVCPFGHVLRAFIVAV